MNKISVRLADAPARSKYAAGTYLRNVRDDSVVRSVGMVSEFIGTSVYRFVTVELPGGVRQQIKTWDGHVGVSPLRRPWFPKRAKQRFLKEAAAAKAAPV